MAEIGAHDRVGLWLQFGEEVSTGELVTGSAEILPEAFRDVRTVHLFRENRERLLPLRERRRPISLFEVHDSKLVVNVGAIGREFNRVLVIRNCAFRVTGVRVVITQRRIAGRRCGALLEDRGEKIVSLPKLRCSEVMAISRSVVEPRFASQLLRPVYRLCQSRANSVVTQRRDERVIDFWRGFDEVEANESCVGLVPDWQTSLATRLNRGMSESRSAMSYRVVCGSFA